MSTADLPVTVTQRRALIYVRQSSNTQVHDNLESQRRQYALADLAHEYGFRDVVTIDEDLGRSASGLVARPGFESVVAQLCQGGVGAVFCLEASRLARNGREWHHLLELCGLVGARVIDPEGIYDPGVPNDRLLLGLKGTISEFELTLMRRRLLDGVLAKAKRGEFRIGLPVGFLWTREQGIELDPDRRVQEVIRTVLDLFERLGSGRRVHRHMCREGLLFPRPVDGKSGSGVRIWIRPAYRNVMSILQNPCYAGVYAYGRSTHRTQLVEGRLSKSYGHSRPMESWTVLLRDHHPGYISWETFERNRQQLHRNDYRQLAGSPKSARGGHALLAGLLRCRRCGRMLRVFYTGHAPRHPRYFCRDGESMHGVSPCITFGASRPDDLIATEVLRAVQPLAVEAALVAMELADQHHAERRRALELELEQARYDARLAQRRYEAVDPDLRLVAAELELRWNGALERVQRCEAQLVEVRAAVAPAPDRDALMRLAEDLKTAWQSPAVDEALRQRLVRVLIEEVIADVDETTREIVLVIHWRGGQHSEVRVHKPTTGEHRRRASAEADARIRAMAGNLSDEAISVVLNQEGHRTGQGQLWNALRVASYRRTTKIRAYPSAAGDPRWLTMRGAAATLGVSDHIIRQLIQRGVLPAKQVVPDAPWQILAEDLQSVGVREMLAARRVRTGTSQPSASDNATTR